MLHCYNKAPSCWVWTEAKPPPPFSALWAARLLSTQSGKHLVLICKLFGLSNFWIISSHPAFWLTAKLLIFPERDVPWVGNLLGRSLSITAGTFTALLFLSIWIHWYWIWNTLKLKLKLASILASVIEISRCICLCIRNTTLHKPPWLGIYSDRYCAIDQENCQ